MNMSDLTSPSTIRAPVGGLRGRSRPRGLEGVFQIDAKTVSNAKNRLKGGLAEAALDVANVPMRKYLYNKPAIYRGVRPFSA